MRSSSHADRDVTHGAVPVPAAACDQHRVVKLLDRAPASIKLVSDSEPLQVVHEDTHFLAVSKPPGLRSVPVHRFLGGSAVNRMIGHLGTEPYLLHRCGGRTNAIAERVCGCSRTRTVVIL